MLRDLVVKYVPRTAIKVFTLDGKESVEKNVRLGRIIRSLSTSNYMIVKISVDVPKFDELLCPFILF